MRNAQENFILKHWGKFLVALIVIIVTINMVARNDQGFRTVIQYPTGKMAVKFEAGYYLTWFGRRTVYADFLTYDFTAGDDGKCRYTDNDGVSVRYQDGGEGTVCGIARIGLTDSEDIMLKFNKTYRDEAGARSKLLNQVIPKVLNLTAAQMTSEEAYATKRAEFIRIAVDQGKRGIHKTRLVEKTIVVGVDENGKDELQTRQFPEPVLGKDGLVETEGSDFSKYGITLEQFDLKAWDFEERTRAQISKKREAEQSIAIAKATAKKAYWAEQQVIAEGKKSVAEAEYSALESAKREIVNQEKIATKAVIAAKQEVDVVAQEVLRQQQEVLKAKQEKLAAKETAEKIILLATAESKAKKLMMQADNALQPKLEAEKYIHEVWADAHARRSVPSMVFAGSGSGKDGIPMGSDNEVSNLIKMLTVDTAKRLNYDRSVSGTGE